MIPKLCKQALALLVLGFLCCGVPAQMIVNANFNGGLPGGWTITDGGTTTDTWYVTTGGGFAGNSLNGTNFAFVNSDAAGNSTATILSERLNSPVFNGNLYGQVFLEFDHYYREYSTDSGFVEVFNGTTWVILASYSTNVGGWNSPVHETFNLTPYRNANMRVRFRYEDNNIWAWYWAVDNVEIWAPPANDAEMLALNTPSGSCGLGTNEQVSIDVRNAGTATITSLPVRYRVNNITVTETINASIAPGALYSYTFATPVNMSVPGVYTFSAWTALPNDAFPISDSVVGLVRKSHRLVSTYPYVEDFELGPGAWFATGTNSTWAWGTPNKTVIQGAASGTKAWTTGGLTGDYLDDEQSFLEGPCFDLSVVNSPWVGTDVWWNAEFSWDGAALQASVDGGVSWGTIGAYGDPYHWYTDDAIDGQPGGQVEGWTGRASSGNGSGGYVRAVHSLNNWSGNGEVILRVAFGTDGSVIDDGIAFDDFTVGAQPVLYLGADTLACDSLVLDAGVAASYEWSTGDTTRYVHVTQSGSYGVGIFDVHGFPTADVIQVQVEGAGSWDLGQDSFYCSTAAQVLSGPTGFQSYLWSTGDTSGSIAVNATGTYVLEAYSPGGCLAMDSVVLGFTTLQAGMVLPGDTLCRGVVEQFMDGSQGATQWWWDFGNGSFSSNANPVQVYMAGGTYYVQLVASDVQCSDTVGQWVYVDLCTGIAEEMGVALQVGPNPARDRVWLRGEAGMLGKLGVELVNAHGQVLRAVSREVAGAFEVEVGLDGVASGVYWIRLLGDRGKVLGAWPLVVE